MKTTIPAAALLMCILFICACDAPKKRYRSVACPSFGGDHDSRTALKEVEIRKSDVKESHSDVRIADAHSEFVSHFPAAGQLTAGEINDYSKWKMWEDITENQLKEWQTYWRMKPAGRYPVQVTTEQGSPVTDCQVQLVSSEGYTLWTSRTDNTGKAELWRSFSEKTISGSFSLKITHEGKTITKTNPADFYNGINIIKIPASCNAPEEADVAWVVDATGSMGDEISYLQSELNDVIEKVKSKHKKLKFRMGSVFYRDNGDAYITRTSDLSPDISKTIGFIKQQSASGGGDYPEAVDAALNSAIHEMSWSKSARTRLLFLVLDAPPHYSESVLIRCRQLTEKASEMGIRIIPIAGSGIDKSTEYLMRCLAIATNGTYVFLTDHSGIGAGHIEPTTDTYNVELLNNLLIRLFDQYTRTSECEQPVLIQNDTLLQDTVFVMNTTPIPTIPPAGSVPVHDTRNFPPIANADTAASPLLVPPRPPSKINTTTPDQIITLSMKLFPNPTRGNLTVELTGDVREVFLADMSGKLMNRYETKGEKRLDIFIGDYASGIYYIKYLYGDRWQSGKVVLVH